MEIDYLLDRLDEPARAEFQSRILEDAEAFAKVSEVENELFDAYASGSLPSDLRSRFERTLLRRPGADRKLAVARQLAASRPAQRGGRRWWLAVAAGIFAAAAGLRRYWPEPRVTSAGIELRIPAIERGDDEIPVFDVPRGERFVDLVVPVPAGPVPAQGYAAVLTAPRGAEVAQWSGIQPDRGELRFRVAAGGIPEGAYLLTVRDAAGPLAFHEFRTR